MPRDIGPSEFSEHILDGRLFHVSMRTKSTMYLQCLTKDCGVTAVVHLEKGKWQTQGNVYHAPFCHTKSTTEIAFFKKPSLNDMFKALYNSIAPRYKNAAALIPFEQMKPLMYYWYECGKREREGRTVKPNNGAQTRDESNKPNENIAAKENGIPFNLQSGSKIQYDSEEDMFSDKEESKFPVKSKVVENQQGLDVPDKIPEVTVHGSSKERKSTVTRKVVDNQFRMDILCNSERIVLLDSDEKTKLFTLKRKTNESLFSEPTRKKISLQSKLFRKKEKGPLEKDLEEMSKKVLSVLHNENLEKLSEIPVQRFENSTKQVPFKELQTNIMHWKKPYTATVKPKASQICYKREPIEHIEPVKKVEIPLNSQNWSRKKYDSEEDMFSDKAESKFPVKSKVVENQRGLGAQNEVPEIIEPDSSKEKKCTVTKQAVDQNQCRVEMQLIVNEVIVQDSDEETTKFPVKREDCLIPDSDDALEKNLQQTGEEIVLQSENISEGIPMKRKRKRKRSQTSLANKRRRRWERRQKLKGELQSQLQ